MTGVQTCALPILDVSGIEKFDGSGTFLTAWSGGFNFKPVGVATDASGNVYVVDYGNNRVQKFACP